MNRGVLVLKYVSTLNQLADLFTKALETEIFLKLSNKIKLIECLNLDAIKDSEE